MLCRLLCHSENLRLSCHALQQLENKVIKILYLIHKYWHLYVLILKHYLTIKHLVSMRHLQRVRRASRERLPFRTLGSVPLFWDLHVLQLLRPDSSNLPCLYSTFHLEYPLVLSRFSLESPLIQNGEVCLSKSKVVLCNNDKNASICQSHKGRGKSVLYLLL